MPADLGGHELTRAAVAEPNQNGVEVWREDIRERDIHGECPCARAFPASCFHPARQYAWHAHCRGK